MSSKQFSRSTLLRLINKYRLYLSTIYYLRPVQIKYQILYRILGAPSLKDAKDFQLRPDVKVDWPHFSKLSTLDWCNFNFLGVSGNINDGWEQTSKSKLWNYNLHYLFDVAVPVEESLRSEQQNLILRWVEENQEPIGNAWESYPISLRLVNVLKFYTRHPEIDMTESVRSSLGKQVEQLYQRLELHILGNHLFVNAKALVFYGLLLDDNNNKYLIKGLEILDTELEEQFLADGGHFELSPMYHALLLWDLLDVIYLIQSLKSDVLSDIDKKLRDKAIKAFAWITAMSHPDGNVSFFNDSAFDIAPTLAQLKGYAKNCDLRIRSNKSKSLITLESTGYSRIEQLNHVLLFDHGPIGPEYLPGHAHADSLCLEWSVGSQRVLVNSGTSIYQMGPLRTWQRSTSAHNTVVIEDKNSSEVWGAFRVGRRAKTKLLDIVENDDVVEVLASHDGYKRVRISGEHIRRIQSSENKLVVEDHLIFGKSKAIAFFYLHPDVQVISQSDASILLKVSDKETIQIASSGLMNVDDANWYPRFGEAIENKLISVKFKGNKLQTSFTILPKDAYQ